MKEGATWKTYEQALAQREAGDTVEPGLSRSGLDKRWTRTEACMCLWSEEGKATEQRPRMSSGKRLEPKSGSDVRNSSERERQAPQEEWSSDQMQWNEVVQTMAHWPHCHFAFFLSFLKEPCTDSESFRTRGIRVVIEPLVLGMG